MMEEISYEIYKVKAEILQQNLFFGGGGGDTFIICNFKDNFTSIFDDMYSTYIL